eukprot:218254-Rhodomonas_salina.5
MAALCSSGFWTMATSRRHRRATTCSRSLRRSCTSTRSAAVHAENIAFYDSDAVWSAYSASIDADLSSGDADISSGDADTSGGSAT